MKKILLGIAALTLSLSAFANNSDTTVGEDLGGAVADTGKGVGSAIESTGDVVGEDANADGEGADTTVNAAGDGTIDRAD